jgi:hypothetical protein
MLTQKKTLFCAVSSIIIAISLAGKVLVDKKTRNGYISKANVWLSEEESSIPQKDLLNGPPNPYGLKLWQTIDCDFVEPTAEDPIGGTTPKFLCNYSYNGNIVQFKIKYDQQYNSVFERWGRPNEEVYASVVSQRLLWGAGFLSDQSIPVKVRCHNCPIEPWTYIQMIQGYDSEDMMSGWMDMKLVHSGEWNKKAPIVTFDSAIVYLKVDEYYDADEIIYYKDARSQNVTEEGFAWHEMFVYPNYHNGEKDPDNTQTIGRNALTAIASFISHCDNFDGNQGFLCVDFTKSGFSSSLKAGKTKDSCKDTPFLYIHDVGGTFGYGWNLKHKNFWPNYFDLQQVRRESTIFS